MFKILLKQSLEDFVSVYEEKSLIEIRNQNKIISNIVTKIRLDRAEDYDWLVSIKKKTSRPRDIELINEFSKLMNNGLVNNDANANLKTISDKINSEIKSMKNLNRARYYTSIYHDFLLECNSVVKDYNNKYSMSAMGINSLNCYNKKRVGDYYKCIIEVERTNAEERKSGEELTQFLVSKILKKYTKKIEEYQD